jgi:hypothetical protein
MSALTIKTHTLAKILGLIFSIAYGFFIIAYVESHFFLDSGDVVSLVVFFEEFDSLTSFLNYASFNLDKFLSGDDIFRIAVFTLKDLFNQNALTVLGIFAFIISSIIFFIYSVNIRSRKYLFYILPLLLMVFFTPRVINLFASGIRSGIAFTILMVAITYLKGVRQYILFVLSTLIHLSMLPMISFYFLFYWLENKKIKLSFTASLFILLSCSFLVAVAAPEFNFSKGVNQSIYYMSLVVVLGLFIIFTNKKTIKNIYGFISIGLILIVFFGYIVDFSFVRYIGNAIIMYLFFVIKEGGVRTLQVFTIGYAPFFMLTLFYSISNYW